MNGMEQKKQSLKAGFAARLMVDVGQTVIQRENISTTDLAKVFDDELATEGIL